MVTHSKKQCFIHTVTAIRHRPHLAHMEADEQKFPITQYFDIPAPLIYCPQIAVNKQWHYVEVCLYTNQIHNKHCAMNYPTVH